MVSGVESVEIPRPPLTRIDARSTIHRLFQLQQQMYGVPQANAYAQYTGYPGYNAYAAQASMGMGSTGMQGQATASDISAQHTPASSMGVIGGAAAGWGAATSQDQNAAAAAAAFYQQQAAAPHAQWGAYYGGQAGGQ
jgi:hypothetical protein